MFSTIQKAQKTNNLDPIGHKLAVLKNSETLLKNWKCSCTTKTLFLMCIEISSYGRKDGSLPKINRASLYQLAATWFY